MDYIQLVKAVLPELMLLATAFIAIGIDYKFFRNQDEKLRSRVASNVTLYGLVCALGTVLIQYHLGIELNLGNGQVVITPLNLMFKAVLIGLMFPTVVFAAREASCEHVSEHYAMLLLSAIGACFLVATDNLLIVFVALELLSLCLYTMTAFYKNYKEATEAGIKYFLAGGVASAFLLFGFSYIYGATNAIDLPTISQRLTDPDLPVLFVVTGFMFILVGMGFKMAAVPFHLWAPDAYTCAPTSVTSWIATGSKVASFLILGKLILPALSNRSLSEPIIGVLVLMSVLSMIVGNIGAIRQKNLKALLAYSSIAHSGYLLIGVIAGDAKGTSAVLFYVIIYAIANMGAFGVIAMLETALGRRITLDNCAGCWRTSPLLAVCLLIFILSLAGIPPLAGFTGKFYLFFALVENNPIWFNLSYALIALAIFTSAFALYYYLRLLKACIVKESPESTRALPLSLNLLEQSTFAALAFATVFLGVYPMPLMRFLISRLTN